MPIDTSLHKAVQENSIEEVKRLLADGHDPGRENGLGLSPITIAAQMGHKEIYDLLLMTYAQGNYSSSSFAEKLLDVIFTPDVAIRRLRTNKPQLEPVFKLFDNVWSVIAVLICTVIIIAIPFGIIGSIHDTYGLYTGTVSVRKNTVRTKTGAIDHYTVSTRYETVTTTREDGSTHTERVPIGKEISLRSAITSVVATILGPIFIILFLACLFEYWSKTVKKANVNP